MASFLQGSPASASNQNSSEGYAFVTYDRYADAKAAIAEYDGEYAMGQKLRVEMDAVVPPPRSEGRDLASIIGRPSLTGGDGDTERGAGRAPRVHQRRGAAGVNGNTSKKASTRRAPVTVDDLDAELDNYINQRPEGNAQKVADTGASADGGAEGMQID